MRSYGGDGELAVLGGGGEDLGKSSGDLIHVVGGDSSVDEDGLDAIKTEVLNNFKGFLISNLN